jgi:hypothetical protein
LAEGLHLRTRTTLACPIGSLDRVASYGMSYGVPTMTHRTTFALDRITTARLRRLAAAWQVSQAEAVRRAVAQADAQARPNNDPIAALRELHDSGQGVDPQQAQAYMTEVREDRKHWSGHG